MSRARRYIAPIARLTVFVAVCAAVLLYVDYRIARASVMDRLLGIGHRMAPFLDNAHDVEAPRELHINGLRLWAAAGKTDHAPAEVRHWYAERYAGKGTAMDVATEAFKLAKLMPPTASGLSQAQFGDDNFGGMAALDLGQGLTMKSLRAAMNQLASGKIGEVGHLRYMYYERTSTGGTRYLTIWSDDKLDLTKFLPSGTEDAPGRDLEDVPRYPGTVRVLSADERGKPGQLVVYASDAGSRDAAAMFYDARMRTLGWQSDERFARTAREQGLTGRRFVNGKGHEVVVDLSDVDKGRGVTVTAIQLK